jgi:hypothetical protein
MIANVPWEMRDPRQRSRAGRDPAVIYGVADVLLGGGDVGGVVVGVGGGGVVGGNDVGVVVCVWVGVGELLCGVGEGAAAVGLLCTGDVASVLFAGPGTVAGLLPAWRPVPLLLPWPFAELVAANDAGLLIVGPAPDPPVLRGFAPMRPADCPGAGVLPALGVVPGDAAE